MFWRFLGRKFLFGFGCAAGLGLSATADAITTSGGQLWNSVPDAWVRGNNADTAYFGWDVLEANGPPLSFGRVLDDNSPDIAPGTTATNTRLYQGTDGIANPAPTAYGHRSGSGNYYSGFGATDFAFDTITAVAPASGVGGFTTVVLQVIAGAPGGNGAQALVGLDFAMQTLGWTKEKSLYGLLESGTGVYWQEWTALGANLPLTIRMTSSGSSRSIDAFQVDTYWSSDQKVVNSRTSIGVPEPGSFMLAASAAMISLLPLRVWLRASQGKEVAS